VEDGISLAAATGDAREPGARRTGAPGRYAYKLLLVALLTCSSRADDAEEDHHPIMMASGVEVGVLWLRYGWFALARGGKGARDGALDRSRRRVGELLYDLMRRPVLGICAWQDGENEGGWAVVCNLEVSWEEIRR